VVFFDQGCCLMFIFHFVSQNCLNARGSSRQLWRVARVAAVEAIDTVLQ
jgi:hypothetical protein